MVWTNSTQVYHGTRLSAARQIISGGVQLTLCRARADFGSGFYVTTVLHQAEQWANQRVRNLPAGVTDVAAVLTFTFDRDAAGTHTENLAFVVDDQDFRDFVRFNRVGGVTHHRATNYDIVYGPLAAFPQALTYANCDQICFLTPSALATLGPPHATPRQGNPYF